MKSGKDIKVAFTGTRGIMLNSSLTIGGFEKFVAKISERLVRGFPGDVMVYTPHYISTPANLNGIKIRKIFAPERYMGVAGTILYDFLAYRDALKKDFDLIFECGYGSFFPAVMLNKKRKKPYLAVNMDGFEWKRFKNPLFRNYMLFVEKVTVKHADYIIADHPLIRDYFKEKYGISPFLLSYGSEKYDNFTEKVPHKYGLQPYKYFIVVARPIKENNIELIFKAFGTFVSTNNSDYKLVWVTNTKARYAKKIRRKYNDKRFLFLEITGEQELFSLRHYAKAYIHGHSVGGTNPSLLEAIFSDVPIIAFHSPFNIHILGNDNCYFRNVKELISILFTIVNGRVSYNCKPKDINRVEFLWDKVVEKYYKFLIENAL